MPNALQHETSPYLLQHAENPVDWLPWTEDTLEKARTRNQPILLSIGYSACHWCHVMAHESFEDDETAALMNELYVNIKVDREERPDLDRIYQLSQQLFTGRAGGWPLTVFLTPHEQWPIFAGTYFPRETSYGMPSFKDVLRRVNEYFRHHRTEIDANAARLLDALQRTHSTGTATSEADARLRDLARSRLAESFDTEHGGFGGAPKFPHPAETGFLLRLDDERARQMAVDSLRAMATGGLFDHLGGGFFRYCVDSDWRIPHFEKMLYDNAALLGCMSEAYAITRDPICRAGAVATADWLLRDMRDPGGGFYATLDADTEGEEGKYYTFLQEDLRAHLTGEETAAASAHFGLDEPANFEGRAWHLQPRLRASPFGEADAPVEDARRKLLALRESRTRPGRDEKILTSWNGLAIGNLARAARHLDRPDLGQAATDAVDFIRSNLFGSDELLAVFKDGRARFPAYLDDYALLASGLVELMQWRFRVADLEFAILLTDSMLEHFADPAGGFFFTADNHERLIHRPKPLADESLPSGNGQAALVLDTLGHLLGEPRYLDAAAATIHAALPAIEQYPEAHASLLLAIERRLEPPELVIVRAAATELDHWRNSIGEFSPDRLCFLIPDGIDGLPGLLASRTASERAAAYVCRGTECRAPIYDCEELAAVLASESSSEPPGDRPSPA